jgi:hypothetical protein
MYVRSSTYDTLRHGFIAGIRTRGLLWEGAIHMRVNVYYYYVRMYGYVVVS